MGKVRATFIKTINSLSFLPGRLKFPGMPFFFFLAICFWLLLCILSGFALEIRSHHVAATGPELARSLAACLPRAGT